MIVECSPHYYGSDCNTPCGQCTGDDVCNNMTGHCPNGCRQHWTGQNCDGVNIVAIIYTLSNTAVKTYRC